MTPLPTRLADLFHLSWPGLLVYQDHRGEVERVELTAGGEVLDTYTLAQMRDLSREALSSFVDYI